MTRRTAAILVPAALLALGQAASADQGAPPRPPSSAALGQPSPVARISDIVQFGMPADRKFVFCATEECPGRTAKHLSDPPAPAPLMMPRPAAAVAYPVAERAAPPAAKPSAPQARRKASHTTIKKHTNHCGATK